MNWDALGAIGELVGGVAVVASLVYLGLQIRRNTISTQTATEIEAGKSNFEWVLRWADDDRLMKTWDKVAQGEMEASDIQRYLWMITAHCALSQSIFDQFEKGMVSDRCWGNFERTLIGLLEPDFAKVWWKERGGNFSPEFCDYMDRKLEADPTWTPPSAAQFLTREDA